MGGIRGNVWRARSRYACCRLLQDARRAGPLHKVEDPRVDVAVYFIAPHRLKQMDCQFMAELSKVIPVLPVLAKVRAAIVLMAASSRDGHRILLGLHADMRWKSRFWNGAGGTGYAVFLLRSLGARLHIASGRADPHSCAPVRAGRAAPQDSIQTHFVQGHL